MIHFVRAMLSFCRLKWQIRDLPVHCLDFNVAENVGEDCGLGGFPWFLDGHQFNTVLFQPEFNSIFVFFNK